MKRLLSFLLLAALLLTALPCAAEDGFTELSDAEGFLDALATDPDGNYRLTADIDLGGIDWTPLPFRGTLDGGGCCIYNLSVHAVGAEVRVTKDGNLKPYDTAFSGLFSVLEGAEVYDLRLRGARIELDALDHCFAGLLAGGMFDSTVRGCDLEGRVRLNNYAVMSGVGGVAGYGAGTVADCAVAAELVFEDRNFDSRCEEFLGGVLSCGIATITGCTVDVQGWDSCHGYVHNGGMVGMYYHCGTGAAAGPVSGNAVRGQITFFEDNWDRRAYCSAIIGETLSYPAAQTGNTTDFQSNEVWTYDRVLLPEQCETPSYVETVTEPGCDTWGSTEHRCETCGYHWTDSYTPPAHTPGEWEAAGDSELLRCAVCGTVLDRRELPPVETEPPEEPEESAEPEPAECRVEPASLTLRYKDTAMLSAAVSPEGLPVTWGTTDPNVVTVDSTGRLYATGRGSAEVLCYAGNGEAEGRCAVTVDYSVAQWIIMVLLFGWIWY